MTTDILVKDIMIPKVLTLTPDNTVKKAAKIMSKRGIGMIVICENNKPIGVITRDDIIDKITATGKPRQTKIKKTMNKILITCSPEDDIADISKKMVRFGYKRLPVISAGKLVGIISYKEIIKIAPTEIETLREKLLQETPPQTEETTDGECDLCGNFSQFLQDVNDRWVCDNCKEEAGSV